MKRMEITMKGSKTWIGHALVVALVGGLVGCDSVQTAERTDHQEESGTEQGHEQEAGHTTGAIQLSAAQMAEFGITIETAAPGEIGVAVELPGEVRPDQDRLAHLVPRFGGIVKSVKKRVGDPVKEGDVLALIESSESLASYRLKSLIDGTVIAKHITRGEAVSSATEAFVVADLGSVWVDLSIYQSDLDRIRVGQSVVISAGKHGPSATATISYVSPVVDEKTRTALARIVLPNPEGHWRPGLFVTGTVTVEMTLAAVTVPREAVQTVGEESIVFVPDLDGLEPRPVTLGRSSERRVEILAGLSAGDRFVARGSFTLKSELGKAGFEAGHGH